MSRFSSNGSPTCTDGRLSRRRPRSKPGRREHARAADAVAPGGRAEQHGEVADALAPGRARAAPSGSTPRQSTLTSGLSAVAVVEHDLAADGRARRPSCRSRRCRDTTPSAIQRLRASSSGPKRSGSISAIGRAPIEKMSRRMPPTPVAAPWYGSMADGWLWLSMRMAAAMPSPTSTTPAPSPGPDEHPRRLGRAAAGGGCATTCTSSAPTTSPSTSPARGGSARGRGSARCRAASSSVSPRRAVDRLVGHRSHATRAAIDSAARRASATVAIELRHGDDAI